MKFIYNKLIDEKCIAQIEKCDLIFGEKKKVDFFPVNSLFIKKIESIWTLETEKVFLEKIFEIFNEKLPENFTCFFNSTPYSMDIEEGISISAGTTTPIRTICHEANHFMFRRSKYKEKYFSTLNIEDAKEIFTVINNIYFKDIMENQDIGWKKFWKERYCFLCHWVEDKIHHFP